MFLIQVVGFIALIVGRSSAMIVAMYLPPHVRARTEMGKHIVEGPFAAALGTVQSSARQTRGKRGDGLRLLRELSQDLVDGELSVVHDIHFPRESFATMSGDKEVVHERPDQPKAIP